MHSPAPNLLRCVLAAAAVVVAAAAAVAILADAAAAAAAAVGCGGCGESMGGLACAVAATLPHPIRMTPHLGVHPVWHAHKMKEQSVWVRVCTDNAP